MAVQFYNAARQLNESSINALNSYASCLWNWAVDNRPDPESPIQLAEDGAVIHTPTMTLKSAALLALIGTILVTALLVWDLVFDVLNVVRGLVPVVKLFSSLIYTFGAFSVALFFFVFHKRQS
jgi:hypothetical protein